MTKYLLLLFAASLVLVAVPVAQATRAATSVTVTAGKPSEFKFKLSVTSVKHGAVTFKFTDSGTLPHDFAVCNTPAKTAANACAHKGTAVVSPGGTATLKITFAKAGTYEYICNVPGHAAAGMKGLLKVT
jgi:uncharacterized cupredoxin-like copper-binding protein